LHRLDDEISTPRRTTALSFAASPGIRFRRLVLLMARPTWTAATDRGRPVIWAVNTAERTVLGNRVMLTALRR
jgi:hypothetical protein